MLIRLQKKYPPSPFWGLTDISKTIIIGPNFNVNKSNRSFSVSYPLKKHIKHHPMMKRTIPTIAFLLCALFSSAQNWNEIIKAVAIDRGINDNFGYSVSISGDYAIVGAKNDDQNVVGSDTLFKSGSAYIFKLTGGTWVQQQKLVASDRDAEAEFGFSVAISGNFATVGSVLEDKNATGSDTLINAGAAYVFEQVAGTWIEKQKLVASDRGENDRFGFSVAIDGDYIIIGARLEDEDASGNATLNNAGSAYIFKQTNGLWLQQQKIVSSDRANLDFFGSCVAINANFAIVGAPIEDEDSIGANTLNASGSVYIFKQSNGVWSQTQKIVANDREAAANFGSSIAVANNYLVVGAVSEDKNVNGSTLISNAGAAYIFQEIGGSWVQQQKIIASDREAEDFFGNSVAINGNYIIVGSRFEDDNVSGADSISNAGAAYIYKLTNGVWSQQQKIVASDRAEEDQFGFSVAINNDFAIVGAFGQDVGAQFDVGAAYIFSIRTPWYLDADNDGWYVSNQLAVNSPGTGWTNTLPGGGSGDCDDNNNTIWQLLPGYVDADADSFTIGAIQDICSGNTLPQGYNSSSLGEDADDNNPDITTSINNLSNASEAVKIYPNPTSNNFIVELQNGHNYHHLQITDMAGKEILQSNIEAFTTQTQVNSKNLSPGMYIVRLTGTTFNKTQKLVRK
jgi:hypothetical protein